MRTQEINIDEVKRILLVDDGPAIHKDFRKILTTERNQANDDALEEAKNAIFGKKPKEDKQKETFSSFIIDSAYQGQEALDMVEKAIGEGKPYALAFVDVRMPPGWDGIATVKRLWEVDPDLQIVICTAYSDYSWEEIRQQLGDSDAFLILKKPFDIMEVRQLAEALTTKWGLKRQVQFHIDNLENLVDERTSEVEHSASLIKATLEATKGGIIAISQEKKVITFNRQFLEMWQLERENAQEKLENFLHRIANQVEEKNLFLSLVNDLISAPQEGDVREWKLKNGKIFELYTRPQILHNEIKGCVFSFVDITERKRLEEQLLHEATHDHLTGLPNRLLVMDRIQQAVISAKRHQFYVGVLLFDIDYFKQVNDSLGHNAGDELLKIVANKLRSSVREADTVARLGGDEFVVILLSLKRQEELVSTVDKLQALFKVPCDIDNHKLTTTVSIGISVYPKDGDTPEVLLKNADAALYVAKAKGRNSYQFYKSEFNAHILKRLELITALRQALENKELFLNYQPLIHLSTDKTIGFEALLRWQHPTFGLVKPDTFIPLAEETGLIVEIGQWVLETACLQCKKWQQTICSDLNVAVNVSGYQFKQKNFVEVVNDVLKKTGLAPQHLNLEITESVILGDTSDVHQKMLSLKEIGVNFSIDDFGTGCASLSYLKYFPFDVVKIDRSFIRDLSISREDSAIVEAIISMTKPLGISVLAEGVEKEDQIEFLRKHNTTTVQGFYYSRPLDEENFAQFLKEKSSQKFDEE